MPHCSYRTEYQRSVLLPSIVYIGHPTSGVATHTFTKFHASTQKYFGADLALRLASTLR